jgi:hypothetical protein
LGSYTYIPVGSHNSDIETLAQPINNDAGKVSLIPFQENSHEVLNMFDPDGAASVDVCGRGHSSGVLLDCARSVPYRNP